MTVWHLSFLSSLSFTRYFAFSSLQVTFRICPDCHPEVFLIFVQSIPIKSRCFATPPQPSTNLGTLQTYKQRVPCVSAHDYHSCFTILRFCANSLNWSLSALLF